MKKSETAQILTMISAMYRSFEITTLKIDLWHDLIGDLQFQVAQMALKKVMLTSEFPPTVADIRKATVDITHTDEDILDAGKAWGEVQKAIQTWGFYEPEKAFGMMAPTTQQIVKQIGWTEICMSENLSVIRGQFMKMYDTVKAREQQMNLLPQGFRNQIKALGENLSADKQIASAKENIHG